MKLMLLWMLLFRICLSISFFLLCLLSCACLMAVPMLDECISKHTYRSRLDENSSVNLKVSMMCPMSDYARSMSCCVGGVVPLVSDLSKNPKSTISRRKTENENEPNPNTPPAPSSKAIDVKNIPTIINNKQHRSDHNVRLRRLRIRIR